MRSHGLSAFDIRGIVAQSEIGGGGFRGYNRECLPGSAYIIELRGEPRIPYVVLPHPFSLTRAMIELSESVSPNKIPAGIVKIVTKGFGEYSPNDTDDLKSILGAYDLSPETLGGPGYNILSRKGKVYSFLYGEPIYPLNTYSKTIDVSGRPSRGSAEKQIELAIHDVLSAVDEIDRIVDRWAKK